MSVEATTENAREVHLRGALGAVRMQLFNDREHLVVPVVALMDGVIHAVNAATPERVTAAALAKSAHSWNGRALTLGHPMRNGTQVSANDHAVLESQAFGTIFNSRVVGTKLLMDAFIDPVRAERIGGAKFLESLKNGETCEVSVGAYVTTDATAGHLNGKTYNATWLEMAGDHLAFLPGGKGACSVEMGCGAHRAAAMHLVTAEAIEVEGDVIKSRSLRERLKDMLLKTADSQADELNRAILEYERTGAMPLPEATVVESTPSEEVAELIHYEAIAAALKQAATALTSARATADELIAAEEIDPAVTEGAERAEEEIETARLDSIQAMCMLINSSVGAVMELTYKLSLPHYADPVRYAEALRTAIGARNSAKDQARIQEMHDRSVALGADCVKTLAAKKYKDCVACKGTGSKDGNPCDACDGNGKLTAAEANKTTTTEATTDGTAVEENDTMTKTPEQRAAEIKALTSCPCSGFTAADVKMLEAAASDERLDAFKTLADGRKADADKIAADLKTAQDKVTETEAALKAAQAAQIPAEELTELRTLATEKKTADAAQKATLVGQLKTAQTAFTEAELNEKPVSELLKLAQMAKVEQPRNFSGLGVAVPRTASTGEDYAAPDSYAPALKQLQAAK